MMFFLNINIDLVRRYRFYILQVNQHIHYSHSKVILTMGIHISLHLEKLKKDLVRIHNTTIFLCITGLYINNNMQGNVPSNLNGNVRKTGINSNFLDKTNKYGG